MSTFSSVYRFRVKRTGGHGSLYGDNNKAVVTVDLASLSCNPTVNRPVAPQFLHNIHQKYLKLLFRDGMAEVMNLTGQATQL
ncbi:hypothetical protein ACRALDRAFT_1063059 [Sodiomyces alcalophilus JCM 7366]|uniref:uncharacterized protein n=1 Tax=Sodiomyces alcalophilus JCM 7366 TaxID=591952 RepID=UPI0039B3904B